MTSLPLLQVQDLRVHFPVRPSLFRRAKDWVRAVEGVSFEIALSETLGVVGESGCGKTTLGRAVVRLLDPTSGQIFFDNKDITRLNGARLRALRSRFQM